MVINSQKNFLPLFRVKVGIHVVFFVALVVGIGYFSFIFTLAVQKFGVCFMHRGSLYSLPLVSTRLFLLSPLPCEAMKTKTKIWQMLSRSKPTSVLHSFLKFSLPPGFWIAYSLVSFQLISILKMFFLFYPEFTVVLIGKADQHV